MISVIIPVYNAELYLRDCVESILNQSFSDYEVVLIDDGSKDKSGTICEEYASNNEKVRYFRQDNSGVAAARNLGIKEAKGQYVCFVDADDIVSKDYLKQLFEDTNTPTILGMCHYTRDLSELSKGTCESLIIPVKEFVESIFNESIVHPGIYTMLFNKEIIDKYQIAFTVGCVRNEDTEFYIKYMTHIEYVCLTDFKGYYYRDNPISAVHKFDIKTLTYIEADERISKLLIDAGLFNNKILIVPASVQYFVYKTPRFKSRAVYDEVHNRYNVRLMMREMLNHPRTSRKIVAALYLLLGKSVFYKLLSVL